MPTLPITSGSRLPTCKHCLGYGTRWHLGADNPDSDRACKHCAGSGKCTNPTCACYTDPSYFTLTPEYKER